MYIKILLSVVVTFLVLGNCNAQQKKIVEEIREPVSFKIKSLDGLQVQANIYLNNFSDKGLIILCHQAGWSSGEYKYTAPKLMRLGYNCLAIDQRSGGEVNNVPNKTVARAKNQNKIVDFLSAEQDIVAAVRWAKKNNKGKSIILCGSSYSASLVLKVAQDEGVDKVLSFSPGEYFGDKMTLIDNIDKLDIPVFITCAKKEIERTQPIFDIIPSENKTFFKPTTEGNHGSRALWSKFDDSKDYWEAVKAFLK